MSPLTTLIRTVDGYLEHMNLSTSMTDDGLYLFKYGSTVIMVSLFEEDVLSFCRFTSVVLADFEPAPDILKYINQLNCDVLFGTFLLFESDTLSFSVTLLGNNLSKNEFETTLQYVAEISDDYDDVLQLLTGGKRASELLGE